MDVCVCTGTVTNLMSQQLQFSKHISILCIETAVNDGFRPMSIKYIKTPSSSWQKNRDSQQKSAAI
jgi:hypothetical protein